MAHARIPESWCKPENVFGPEHLASRPSPDEHILSLCQIEQRGPEMGVDLFDPKPANRGGFVSERRRQHKLGLAVAIDRVTRHLQSLSRLLDFPSGLVCVKVTDFERLWISNMQISPWLLV